MPRVKFKFQAKIRLLKTSIRHHELDSFPISQDFSNKIGVINRCAFLILYNNEMCQRLEDLHNSVSQYFSSDKCMMLPNHTWVKHY